MSLAEYRDCPDCGTPVVRGPNGWRMIKGLFTGAQIEPGDESIPCGPGLLEYTTTGHRVWTVHSATRCMYVAVRDGRDHPMRGIGL